jgi:superfamily II DNA or RNA helicase
MRNDVDRFFGEDMIRQATRILQFSPPSISYHRGDFDTKTIIAGIVRDSAMRSCKFTYRQQEDQNTKNFTSNCDCPHWKQEEHCQHVASLFIFALANQERMSTLGQRPSLDQPATGVRAPIIGTVISSPQKLNGASVGATYSSLNYQLLDGKQIGFPMPKPWIGKLVANFVYPIDNTAPYIRFMHNFNIENEATPPNHNISIFENLFLYDWNNGDAFHLSKEVKDFIHRFRLRPDWTELQDLLNLVASSKCLEQIEIYLNGKPLKHHLSQEGLAKIYVNKSPGGQTSLSVMFENFKGQEVIAPRYLQNFAFEGGTLTDFKTRKMAYESLQKTITQQQLLQDSEQEIRFKPSLEDSQYLLQASDVYEFDAARDILFHYDSHFLLNLPSLLNDCFSDLAFKRAKYAPNAYTIHIPEQNFLQGIEVFHQKLQGYNVPIFYQGHQLSIWHGKIRIERQHEKTDWFDLNVFLSPEDIEVVRNADVEAGVSVTPNGLVLLGHEQKDLLRFLRRYMKLPEGPTDLAIGENPQEPGEARNVQKKFSLPFSRVRIFELFQLKKIGLNNLLTAEENDLCERLVNLQDLPQYPIPQSVQGVLRPYQTTGYRWLRFLYEHKFGACLADDMGLGKTVQTIAFLDSINAKINKVLIVCPVSILLNWEKEFSKFSDLKVVIYHGGSRNFQAEDKIILTSYGVLKKEYKSTFSEMKFDVMILDEVQHLKNMRSLGAFAARSIKAEFKVCLTGTPVENDITEFYNILDLCVPGIWGEGAFWRGTQATRSRTIVRKVASPYILRRSKAQVLDDLPPKIENNVFLDLNPKERDAYNDILNITREKVLTGQKRYGEILKGLLRLRQQCLWHRTEEQGQSIVSTKIDFLMEQLEQIKEEGHQAIVFSQFTTYLDIIQKKFLQQNWSFSRIDGSLTIKSRQRQVDDFQNGSNKFFLISLKAGGVGLNLTAASYVFIMDPWWNPAVENQAIDRAYRIGQTNRLTVYRPIIKNSVEEKVMQLQEKKKQLFLELLPENEGELFSGRLTWEDFQHLLS